MMSIGFGIFNCELRYTYFIQFSYMILNFEKDFRVLYLEEEQKKGATIYMRAQNRKVHEIASSFTCYSDTSEYAA